MSSRGERASISSLFVFVCLTAGGTVVFRAPFSLMVFGGTLEDSAALRSSVLRGILGILKGLVVEIPISLFIQSRQSQCQRVTPLFI